MESSIYLIINAKNQKQFFKGIFCQLKKIMIYIIIK